LGEDPRRFRAWHTPAARAAHDGLEPASILWHNTAIRDAQRWGRDPNRDISRSGPESA
jgi:hypothetical protein